jgi:hypothetical protein
MIVGNSALMHRHKISHNAVCGQFRLADHPQVGATSQYERAYLELLEFGRSICDANPLIR